VADRLGELLELAVANAGSVFCGADGVVCCLGVLISGGEEFVGFPAF
jgi:hypothetical protein